MAVVADPRGGSGATGEVHDTKQNDLGLVRMFSDGVEYIYLQGVASTLAGSWVTIGDLYTTALLTTGANGRVAVASGAIVANKYGWYAIMGNISFALASSNGTITSGGGQISACSTVPGQVVAQGTSTGTAVGDYIFGAYTYSGQPSSADDIIAKTFLNYPFISNAVAVASS